jgi:glycosyltransferase involved in cell wall biosynthesis
VPHPAATRRTAGEGSLHIVALNWRDLANPLAGGAEVHMEEILRYLGHHGHRCTLLSCGFPGAPREVSADGYRVVRGGHPFDFNLVVPFLYRRVAAREPPDVVLDDINKIPFYSPLFARVPVLAVVPHLMGATVFREVNPLVAAAVFAAEQPVRWVYRHCHFEVISESTRDDLVARGHDPERISVIHCGLDHAVYNIDGRVPKTAAPSLVYVGRIKRYKSVDHAIRALSIVRRQVPDCTLTIVGDGDGLPDLRALAASLGLAGAVHFAGYVPTADKVRLLQSAHAVVNPSVREGWALTNVEANGCGTACVAADSPGLRDSVLAGRTGLLYPYGDVDALAASIVTVLRDRALRERMEVDGVAWARSLTWERCGEQTLALVERVAAERRRG